MYVCMYVTHPSEVEQPPRKKGVKEENGRPAPGPGAAGERTREKGQQVVPAPRVAPLRPGRSPGPGRSGRLRRWVPSPAFLASCLPGTAPGAPPDPLGRSAPGRCAAGISGWRRPGRPGEGRVPPHRARAFRHAESARQDQVETIPMVWATPADDSAPRRMAGIVAAAVVLASLFTRGRAGAASSREEKYSQAA